MTQQSTCCSTRDTLSWFWDKWLLFLLFFVISVEAANIHLIVLDFTRPGPNPMIYRSQHGFCLNVSWNFYKFFASSDLLINLQLKNICVFVNLLELSQIVLPIYLMYCFIYITDFLDLLKLCRTGIYKILKFKRLCILFCIGNATGMLERSWSTQN
jgi:hypothetical protein